MSPKHIFAVSLTICIIMSSTGGVFAQRRPQRNTRPQNPASPRTPTTPSAPAAVEGSPEPPTTAPKVSKSQDFVLSPKEIQAGRVRGLTLTLKDDSVLVDDDSPDIKVEALNATELVIESQQLTPDKKRLLLEVRVPEEAFGTATLRVMRGKEANAPLERAALIDINVSAFQARPIPRKPTPSGIHRVDVMWSVLPDEVVKDNFGTKAAKHYYGIQVVIGNNTGFDLQIAGLGFKTDLKSPESDETGKNAHADSRASNTSSASGSKSEPKFQIPVVDYRYVRGTIEKEQAFGGRARALSFIAGFGTLTTGFLPFFHALGPRANFGTFTSLLNGNFKEGFGLAIPDLTIRQLNRLDEKQVMHDQMIIPNNTQERTVVFVPKGIVQMNPAVALEGGAKFKPTIAQIMSFLGELTLVGRRIKYEDIEDREVVVLRNDAANEPGEDGGTKPTAGPISIQSISPNFGTVSDAPEVMITGSGFIPGEEVKVKFGGDPFVRGRAINATQVKATVPPRVTAGEIDVEVIAGERTNKLANGYTYFDELSVDSFNPTSVPIAGGATVKIKGKGFMSGAEVTVDGVAIANVSVSNDHHEITIIVPAHGAGAVKVVVKNPNGKTFSFANAFTYVAPATPPTPVPTPSPSPTSSPTP